MNTSANQIYMNMHKNARAAKFEDVEIGQHFVANGTRWVKRSSRTASVVTTSEPIFYFGKSELVRITATAN